MNPGKLLRLGVPGNRQPGFTQFCAQSDQALGNRTKVNWRRQLDVEQHGRQRFVNSLGALLE